MCTRSTEARTARWASGRRALGAVYFLSLTLFDLLVLDWWLFCTVQPRFMVLPGTEGMPEYRDFGFLARVLVPRPVPWPLLTIPAYGAAVGTIAYLMEIAVG
ncbi:hypothetical protein [Streptomyces sp. NPDC048636]|uniref:hypothetical protein n=1 Tax=Streptomyces sp. NPDC048636 TaxID=3155762 RepID=UPI00342925DE